MNLFGKKKKANGPTLAESIQQLREAMEILEKREIHLNKQMNTALAEAKKKSKAKDKRGALFHLKRKKMYEKQVDQIYGKKTNIEMQIMTLEAAAGNTEVLSAMRKGADALKRTVKDTDVDKVADVMDDINESMALADELGEAMSQTIGPALDEDELTAELEEMENELVEEDLMKAPIVPSHKPVKKDDAKVKASVKKQELKSVEPEEEKVAVLSSGGSVSASSSGSSSKSESKASVHVRSAEEDELKELEASMGM